jgi:hypothetical protein
MLLEEKKGDEGELSPVLEEKGDAEEFDLLQEQKKGNEDELALVLEEQGDDEELDVAGS